jgi:hypothetical protein
MLGEPDDFSGCLKSGQWFQLLLAIEVCLRGLAVFQIELQSSNWVMSGNFMQLVDRFSYSSSLI